MERADRAQVGRSAVAGKRVESESRAFEQAARAAARMAAVRPSNLGQQELLLDTADLAKERKLFAIPGPFWPENKGPFGSVAPYAHQGVHERHGTCGSRVCLSVPCQTEAQT